MALKDFYHNRELRKEVQEYLKQFLDQEILKKVYSGGDVKALGEAKVVLDKAFENLETLFARKPARLKKPINSAR